MRPPNANPPLCYSPGQIAARTLKRYHLISRDGETLQHSDSRAELLKSCLFTDGATIIDSEAKP